MGELSAVSGCTVPTLKYYLREGLLPAGERTAANQASYDERHVHRVRLIRVLTDIGGLPLGAVRAVLQAIDDPRLSMHDVLGVAHHALAAAPSDQATADETAAAEIDGLLSELGWDVKERSPGKSTLASALSTLRRLGWQVTADVFRPYAEAADELARWELDRTPDGASRERTVEAAVVGTVVLGAALTALRHLAEEHHSSRRFGGTSGRRTRR